MPKAVCGGKEPLRIGNAEIPCYVLDDETRVISVSGVFKALGMSVSGGLPRLVSLARQMEAKPGDTNELTRCLESPVEFIIPGGGLGKGYEADLLVSLCKVIAQAHRDGRVSPRYEQIAGSAQVVLDAFSVVGVVALIDEATGYQSVRRRLALAEILDKYLDDNLNQWTKTFPDEFYEHFFRLKGWNFRNLKAGDVKPAEVGKFTKEEVYRRLHPGIVEELEKSNPYVVPGRRMHKHHQWLTREIGHPTLEKHIAVIIALMRVSRNWMEFENNLQIAAPKASDTGFLGFISEGE